MTLLIWTLGARSAHAAAPSCPTDYFEAIDRRAAMVGTRGAGWFYNTPTFLAPSCGGFNFLYGSSKPLPPEVEEQIRLDHDRNWQRAVKNSLSSKRLLHVTKERHNDALCMVHDDLLATLPFSEKRVAVWEAAAKPPRFDCLDWPAQRQVSIISTGYPKMEGNFGRPCTEQTCQGAGAEPAALCADADTDGDGAMSRLELLLVLPKLVRPAHWRDELGAYIARL